MQKIIIPLSLLMKVIRAQKNIHSLKQECGQSQDVL